MKSNFFQARSGTGFFAHARLAVLLFSVAVAPWTAASAQTTPTPPPYCTTAGSGQTPAYCINWSAVTNGGIQRASNSCYRLNGTIGQLAPEPGYVYQAAAGGGTNYGVFSGFYSAAQTTGLDEIFFDGFEGCGQ
jgi:hypothetical protein